jgi:tetratricopeptide (TPR) repeat protein
MATKAKSKPSTPKKSSKVLNDSARVTELSVKIKRYLLEPEAPLPSLFSRSYPRNIYPYNHRDSQSERSDTYDMRVLRLASKYIEVDILPDIGGHIWGAKDLVSGNEIFHRTDALKHQGLAVAGPWIATGIEFNFPVTHSILCLEKINSAHGMSEDGSAWISIGATDKLFGLQWQITMRLRPDARVIEIDGWLHNPTDLEHPYCYWGNAGFTTDKSLRLYFPFKWSEHHGGGHFKWPGEGDKDLSYWTNLKQPISAFGDGGDKRYFGGYYEKQKFGIVHTADPRTMPGKKYFAWGDGPTGERWGKLLSENLRDYVELQSGTRTDQEFWSNIGPHSTITFHERWQPIDGLGGITDANELLTVYVGQQNGSAIVRAQPTEELKGVKFRAYTDKEEIARWKADLHPTRVFEKKLSYKGPVKLDVDTGKPGMVLRTCDTQLIDYGEKPKSRIEEFDPQESSARAYRRIGRNAMQVCNWVDAKTMYEAALALGEPDAETKEEIGLFRLRRLQFEEAKKLLTEAYKSDRRSNAVLWGLLKAAWSTGDEALEKTVLAWIKDGADLAHVLSLMRKKKFAEALKRVADRSTESLVRERDLGVAVLVASRRAGKADKKLLAALDAAYPIDPVVRFEVGDGSFTNLQDSDIDIGITLADTYLKYGDPETALRAVEQTAQKRKTWQLSDVVLAAWCAKQAGADPANFLQRDVKFDPLAERPWQDAFYEAVPGALKSLPKSAELHLIWGNLLQKYGRNKDAAEAWRRSKELGGDWPSLLYSLAIIDKSCSDEILDQLKALAEKENSSVYYGHYYSILRRSGRRARILKEYEDRLNQAVSDKSAYKKRGFSDKNISLYYAIELVAQGQYNKAVEFMNKTKFPPVHGGMPLTLAHIRARCEQARQMITEKKYDAAKQHLAKCYEVQHNFNEDQQVLNCLVEVNCVMGDIETLQDNPAKAAEYYEKAAKEAHEGYSSLTPWQCYGLMKTGRGAEAQNKLARIDKLIESRLAMDIDFHGHYLYLRAIVNRVRGDDAAYQRDLHAARDAGWGGGDGDARF